MKSFAVLLGIIIVTSLAFWPITQMAPGEDMVAATRVLGMPVLGVSTEQTCWLSIGLGTGVLFVGLVGAGGVAIGLAAGGGLLFGSGQVGVGLIGIGQLGVGLLLTIAQLGVGVTGLGQLMIGVLVKGQLGLGKDGEGFLLRLNQDLNKVLQLRRDPATAAPQAQSNRA
jgi:hypothetical protein